jgi:hypothetical protein
MVETRQSAAPEPRSPWHLIQGFAPSEVHRDRGNPSTVVTRYSLADDVHELVEEAPAGQIVHELVEEARQIIACRFSTACEATMKFSEGPCIR